MATPRSITGSRALASFSGLDAKGAGNCLFSDTLPFTPPLTGLMSSNAVKLEDHVLRGWRITDAYHITGEGEEFLPSFG